jgi:recombinational DNA repair protein (RecF pathway)
MSTPPVTDQSERCSQCGRTDCLITLRVDDRYICSACWREGREQKVEERPVAKPPPPSTNEGKLFS